MTPQAKVSKYQLIQKVFLPINIFKLAKMELKQMGKPSLRTRLQEGLS
jgi:hypothetical protein